MYIYSLISCLVSNFDRLQYWRSGLNISTPGFGLNLGACISLVCGSAGGAEDLGAGRGGQNESAIWWSVKILFQETPGTLLRFSLVRFSPSWPGGKEGRRCSWQMSAVVIGPPLPSPLRHGRPPDACGGHRGVKSRRFSAIFGKSGFLLGSTNLQLFISCSNKVLWRRRTRGRKRKGPRPVWIIGIMKNDIRSVLF